MRYSLEPNYRRYVKGYDFFEFGDKYGKKNNRYNKKKKGLILLKQLVKE